MKDYYTPKEAAELLSVNRRHILRLINLSKLAAYNVGSGQRAIWRISPDQIEKYLKANKSNGKQTRTPQN